MRCPTCKREVPSPATVCPHDGAYLLAPLSDTLKRGPVSLVEATKIVERICALLEPIHAVPRAHARLTPENVFFRHVGSDLTVRITELDETRPIPPARYATPERARGEKEDPRADIYMLGVLLHHMIAGAPPFDHGTEAAIMKKHAEAEPGGLLQLELQDVPEELDVLIKRMLAKSPGARPQTVAEVKELLSDIDTGSTITGAKIAALGPAIGPSLDEPTIETKPVFDDPQRPSQNPTLLNFDKEKSVKASIAPLPVGTGDDIDPYGDTVLRARPREFVAATTEDDAPTKLQIQTRPAPAPLIERSEDETAPPTGPKPPVKVEPRGPTLRTDQPNEAQQTKLAFYLLVVAVAVVTAVIATVLLTR